MPSVFFDTNVVVYANLAAPKAKARRAAAWLRTASHSSAATISVQVLNELFWTLTRKFGDAYELSEAREIVLRLSALVGAPLDVDVHRAAHGVHEATNYRWWDCLLLASAQAAGCTIFLSEDLQHEHRIGALTVIDPFQAAPADVLKA